MTILEAVMKQFNEEVGDEEIKPLKSKEKYALRMKYGLSLPQLTASERYLIKKEERGI